MNKSKLRKNIFPNPALVCLDPSSEKYGHEIDYWEEVEEGEGEEYPWQHANTIAEESCKAAKQLGDIGDEKAVKPLIKLLNGEIGEHIYNIINGDLGTWGEDLEGLLEDLVIKTVIAAAEALGKIGKKSAVKSLKKVKDGTILGTWGSGKNEDVSKAAKLALAKINDPIR